MLKLGIFDCSAHPRGRHCSHRRNGCMRGQEIQCLQNNLQDVAMHLPSAVSKLFDRKARPSAETGRILGVLACLWVRRSRDSRKGWIRNKEIQCLQNTLQDAGIYLQPFPSYSITKPVLRAKNTAAFRHPLSFNPLVRCLPVTTKT